MAKIVRLARDDLFREFMARSEVLGPVRDLLGTDEVSCFLSQFIARPPGPLRSFAGYPAAARRMGHAGAR